MDFCSTQLWRHGEPVEQLRLPRDVARWLTEAGLYSQVPVVTEGEFSLAGTLREAIYRARRGGVR